MVPCVSWTPRPTNSLRPANTHQALRCGAPGHRRGRRQRHRRLLLGGRLPGRFPSPGWNHRRLRNLGSRAWLGSPLYWTETAARRLVRDLAFMLRRRSDPEGQVMGVGLLLCTWTGKSSAPQRSSRSLATSWQIECPRRSLSCASPGGISPTL